MNDRFETGAGPGAGGGPEGSVTGQPPSDRPVVLKMVILAAAAAAVLVSGMAFAAGHGLLPARIVLGLDGGLLAPQTTNPATTAAGSEPIYRSVCDFVATPSGAQCVFSVSDQRGNLVEQGLAISVPRAWLARIPRGTALDDMQVIADLVKSPYYIPDGTGLQSMNISVDPTYAALLASVGVTPQALLQWIYHNVPADRRPPWARG